MSIEIIDRIRIIFCCCFAWSLVILFFWNAKKTFQAGIKELKRLHQIPCDRCTYFTNDYRLKCTLNPTTALSEDAIGCLDFEPGNCNKIGAKRCRKKEELILIYSQTNHQ